MHYDHQRPQLFGKPGINSAGEVTAKRTEFTVSQFGIRCVYGFGSGTRLGTLTPGQTGGAERFATELPKIEGRPTQKPN